MGARRAAVGVSFKGNLWIVKRRAKRKSKAFMNVSNVLLSDEKEKKSYRRVLVCAARCGKTCDGTVFNPTYSFCRTCFEEFIIFCSWGDRSIFIFLDWHEAVKKFIERKKNGARIKSAYAGHIPLGGVQPESKKDPCVFVPGMQGADRKNGSAYGSRGAREQDEESQVSESG